jgi:hypothetical protein
MKLFGQIQKVVKNKNGTIVMSVAYQQSIVSSKVLGKPTYTSLSRKIKPGVWAQVDIELEDSNGQMVWFAKQVKLDEKFKIKTD